MWCFLEARPLVQVIAEGISVRLLRYLETRRPPKNGFNFPVLLQCPEVRVGADS